MKYRNAVENYIKTSAYAYNAMENLIEYRNKFINPAISLFIEEEYKYHSTSANILKEILSLNQKFQEIQNQINAKKEIYDPLKYIRGRNLFDASEIENINLNEVNLFKNKVTLLSQTINNKNNLFQNENEYIRFDSLNNIVRLRTYEPSLLFKAKESQQAKDNKRSFKTEAEAQTQESVKAEKIEKLKNKNYYNYALYNMDDYIDNRACSEANMPQTPIIAVAEAKIGKKDREKCLHKKSTGIEHSYSKSGCISSSSSDTENDELKPKEVGKINDTKIKKDIYAKNYLASQDNNYLRDFRMKNEEYQDYIYNPAKSVIYSFNPIEELSNCNNNNNNNYNTSHLKNNINMGKICKLFQAEHNKKEAERKIYLSNGKISQRKGYSRSDIVDTSAAQAQQESHNTGNMQHEIPLRKNYYDYDHNSINTNPKKSAYYHNKIPNNNNHNDINPQMHDSDHKILHYLTKEKYQEEVINDTNTNQNLINRASNYNSKNKNLIRIYSSLHCDKPKTHIEKKLSGKLCFNNEGINIEQPKTSPSIQNKIYPNKSHEVFSPEIMKQKSFKDISSNGEKPMFTPINFVKEKGKYSAIESGNQRVIEKEPEEALTYQVKGKTIQEMTGNNLNNLSNLIINSERKCAVKKKKQSSLINNNNNNSMNKTIKKKNEEKEPSDDDIKIEKENSHESDENMQKENNTSKNNTINHNNMHNIIMEQEELTKSPRFECWEEVCLPKQISENVKLKMLQNLKKNYDKSFDVFESNISNFSSDFDERRRKNNLLNFKESDNKITNNNNGKKKSKEFSKNKFEAHFCDIAGNPDSNHLIIYDVFNYDNNGKTVDFLDDFTSENYYSNNEMRSSTDEPITANIYNKNMSFDEVLEKMKIDKKANSLFGNDHEDKKAVKH